MSPERGLIAAKFFLIYKNEMNSKKTIKMQLANIIVNTK